VRSPTRSNAHSTAEARAWARRGVEDAQKSQCCKSDVKTRRWAHGKTGRESGVCTRPVKEMLNEAK
jgi:hypothetical protein